MTDTAVATEGLSKSYGRRAALRDLDLRVPAGCVLGFLGPNGAGKTTAIRLLLGLLRPDRGRASIFGRDCWRDARAVKRAVGYVPGDLQLYGWMDGEYALRVCGGARRIDLLAPGRALAARFDLDLRTRVRAMSRGMRQKLGLILALAPEPKLLVLDEPTTALDPLAQERLYAELRARAARGDTVFFSSHVLSEVEDLCDRVAILRDGVLVADEPLAALRRRAGRTVVIRWDGPPPDAAPPFLELRERSVAQWRGALRGAVPELLTWLGGRAVADLEIGPPDLDAVFRTFYREGSR